MWGCSTAGEKSPSLKPRISSAVSAFKLVPLPVWILIWTGTGGCLLIQSRKHQSLFTCCPPLSLQIICEGNGWGAVRGDDKVLVARLAGSLAIRTTEIVIYPMTQSSPPEWAALWLIRGTQGTDNYSFKSAFYFSLWSCIHSVHKL